MMKRWLRIFLWIVLTPIVLFFLLATLIYVPPVQRAVVGYACEKASEATGFDVNIETIGLSFPLDLDVRQVLVRDSLGDTLCCVRRCLVDLNLSNVFDGQIGVDALELSDGFVNSKQLIEGLSVRGRIGSFLVNASGGIDINRNSVSVDDISLSDCDIYTFIGESSEDTTSSSPLPWTVSVRRVRIDNVHALVNMGDSMRIETKLRHSSIDSIAANLLANDYSLANSDLSVDYILLDSLSIPAFAFSANALQYRPQIMGVRLARLSASQSWIEASARADSAFAFDAQLDAKIANADLDSVCRYYAPDLRQYLNGADLSLHVKANGDKEFVDVTEAAIRCGEFADLTASAKVDHPLDSLLSAVVSASLQSFAGNAQLNAKFDNPSEAYRADLKLTALRPKALMPSLPVRSLTADVNVSGRGIDFPRNTTISLSSRVPRLALDSVSLSNISLDAQLRGGRLSALLECADSVLDATATLEAMNVVPSSRSPFEMTAGLDVKRIDLHAFHLVDSLLSVAACMHVDVSSDFKSNHRLTGNVNDILLIRPDTVLRPVNLDFDAMIRPDSLYAKFTAGQMYVEAATQGGIDEVLSKATALSDELSRELSQYRVQHDVLRTMLPTADVRLHLYGRNPVSTYLAMLGYTYEDVRMDLNCNPTDGLNGSGHILSINTGTLQIDTIDWTVSQNRRGIKLGSRVKNGPHNKQFVFDARCNMYFMEDKAGLHLTYDDAKGVRGVDFGAVAQISKLGALVRLKPLNPVIAYRKFEVNEGNYAYVNRHGSILSDIFLKADDGTSVQLYSDHPLADTLIVDSLAHAYQDITASFHNFNLGELSSVMPYLPKLAGILAGDVHYMQQDSTMSVALDTRIDRFAYEDSRIGDVGMNAVYLPTGDGRHCLDGVLSLNDSECASFEGSYEPAGEDGRIDVTLVAEQLPMSIANGFVSPGLAQMSGCINGLIRVNGLLSDPKVNGSLSTHDIRVRSTDYSLNLRIPDDTVRIIDNYLDFDRIEVFSTGANPLVMDGWINFRDLDRIALDLKFVGNNFELINAKKSSSALAYGKVYCDVDAGIRGSLDRLMLNGSLKVLGNTDVTYVLRDSPLTVEDRLSDLVTFTDFSAEDEPQAEPTAKASMDLSMNMKLLIDEAAEVHCMLSEDQASYVNLQGGGELILSYLPMGEMQLNGQYTINSGEMKYQLPIIPLKTFQLERGSYVSFNGKLLNPTLNISATEQVKAQVANEGGASRSVLFDVGVHITQTLEKMGLQFTLEAPEDATIQSELASFDADTRGRMAVTMLATGMYLGGTSSGGLSSTNALNAFLQSEISNLTGKALKSVDVTFGMENTTTKTGSSQTDYSFKFAKRFWGNRISVILGGMVSSGSEAQNTGETIVDNVSIEYRLDQSASRYVRVFYDKAYESLIDGKITEMGAGLVLRRKTTKLGDLFIFRSSKK